MTTKLSRDRVLREITSLGREIEDLVKRIEAKRESLPDELQNDVDDLEDFIVLARQFTTSNVMDFRRVEIALMQLRSIKAQVLNKLEGSVG